VANRRCRGKAPLELDRRSREARARHRPTRHLALAGNNRIGTSTCFQLVNLAEEKERVRKLRRRARAAGAAPLDDSLDEAVVLL
jgi:hypothetical protein